MYVAPVSHVLFGLASVAATSQEVVPTTSSDGETLPEEELD